MGQIQFYYHAPGPTAPCDRTGQYNDEEWYFDGESKQTAGDNATEFWWNYTSGSNELTTAQSRDVMNLYNIFGLAVTTDGGTTGTTVFSDMVDGFTLSFWIWVDGVFEGDVQRYIRIADLAATPTSNTNIDFWCAVDANDNSTDDLFQIYGSIDYSSGTNLRCNGTEDQPYDTWIHAAFTWDRRYLRLYINGTLNATGDAGTTQDADYAPLVGANDQPQWGDREGGGRTGPQYQDRRKTR